MNILKRISFVILSIAWLLLSAVVVIITTIAWILYIPNYDILLTKVIEIAELIGQLNDDK